jgi:hypothetical protein
MAVEDKGWVNGGESAADALWDNMWNGEGSIGAPPGRITEGPLAQFNEDYDPIIHQRQLQRNHQRELSEKTARQIGGDNDFDSPHSPGSNRIVQKGEGSSGQEIQQSPADAKGPSGEGGSQKKDSSPGSGSRGSELMKRMKNKRNGSGDPTKAETTTQSSGPQGEALAAGHALQVKDQAPTPKELDPSKRVGNLADGQQRSAWTGSGPQAALHDDYSKVGELLKLAGVPPRDLPETSLLFRVAMQSIGLFKEAADSSYFARDDVHPLKLVAELSDSLGDDWSDWEPETIRETIIKEAGVEPSDDVMSKIMAIKIVLARPDRFFDDWHAFEKISVALNDRSPMMGTLEEVPVEWLSNSVAIVEKVAAEGDFGPEVRKYVAARLFDQGYVVPPPKLAFASGQLSKKVNNEDMQKKVILAYSNALSSEDVPQGEDPVSIQVTRLLRNHVYVLDKLEESRTQLS